MPATYSTKRSIKHPFQTFVETTDGTFPGSGTGTAFPFATLEFEIDGQYIDVGQVGPEDLLALIRGNKISRVRLSTVLSADTWNLLKWLATKIDFDTPSDTPAESRSGLFSVRFGSNVNYIKILGMKPESGDLKVESGKPIEFAVTFSVMDINDPTTTAPVGVTLATAFPSGAVYHHKNAALSFNGTSITVKSFNCSINRGTEEETVIGQETPYGNQAMFLDATGQFSGLWGVNASPLTDFNADTKGSMVLTFAASKTLTFNAKLLKQKVSVDNKGSGGIPMMWDFKYIDGMTVAA
jgi:hypothetical protein